MWSAYKAEWQDILGGKSLEPGQTELRLAQIDEQNAIEGGSFQIAFVLKTQVGTLHDGAFAKHMPKPRTDFSATIQQASDSLSERYHEH